MFSCFLLTLTESSYFQSSVNIFFCPSTPKEDNKLCQYQHLTDLSKDSHFGGGVHKPYRDIATILRRKLCSLKGNYNTPPLSTLISPQTKISSLNALTCLLFPLSHYIVQLCLLQTSPCPQKSKSGGHINICFHFSFSAQQVANTQEGPYQQA